MTDDPAEDNRTRAYWGLCALEAFARKTGQGDLLDGTLNIPDDILMEVGGDLLCDLFHLARLNDVDPDQLTDRGRMHYDAEAAEEWPDAYQYKAIDHDPSEE
ncbi:hypothetical protein ABZ027_31710 [Streptomyces sp. NPDC006332]|uniref:hypothetical protein n=1 Tax=Streptomyces sp. NPDC006332 TaxID=3155456 RepID=UPI0033A01D90